MVSQVEDGADAAPVWVLPSRAGPGPKAGVPLKATARGAEQSDGLHLKGPEGHAEKPSLF